MQKEINLSEKIIFKKQAFEDLASCLTKYNKVLIITSLTPKSIYANTLSNYLNEKQVDFKILALKENVCNNKNLILCSSNAIDVDCLVAFGAGTVCDVVKLVAKNLKLPYFNFLTTISHFGFLNDISYFKNEFTTKKTICSYPEKVFIDEGIIQKSSDRFISSTFSFIFSFYELYFNEVIKSMLFSNFDYEFANKLKEILKKTEGLINYININKKTVILDLMDNIIELFVLTDSKELDSSPIELASLSYQNRKNFGKECLLQAVILMKVYNNFWNSNLEYQDTPQTEEILKLLFSRGEKAEIYFNFMKDFEKFTTKQFFFKTKSLKQNCLKACEDINIRLTKISRKLSYLYTSSESKIIAEKQIFDNLTYHALKSNNFQLNSILRLGYLNVIV